MKCPFCGFTESKVVDSRSTEDGSKIRRRRECLQCEKRFTTYEYIEAVPIIVIKKNKYCEPFDREKLLQSMLRACKKSEIDIKALERAVEEIETVLLNSPEHEVTSVQLGEYALEKLMDINQVAYVRFASVYRQFKDIDDFLRELKKLSGKS
jgi:transcriptional regulator NrdR